MLNMQKEQLAMYGAKPVREKMLPYGKQWVDETDIENVVNVLRSDFLSSGPEIPKFEEALAREAGTRYAVAFSSGTAALHAACFAAGVETGSEVITSPLTFAASSNCILYTGGKPVFADIDPLTFNIDSQEVYKKITPNTKALIIVDFAGQPAQYNELYDMASNHGLVTIRDAAHSIGSIYKERRPGMSTDMTIFSFHPVKHITTGEGGAVVTDREDFYHQLLMFRNHGITRDEPMLEQQNSPKWYYEMQFLGYNYRITDIQAALGTSQLKRLEQFVKRRRELAVLYNKAFEQMPGLAFQQQAEEVSSSWHLYPLRWKKDFFSVSRDTIFQALLAENIGVNLHYIPVYLHPYYQSLGYQRGICPNAEAVYEELITIPLFPLMTDRDLQDVVDAVVKVYNYFLK